MPDESIGMAAEVTRGSCDEVRQGGKDLYKLFFRACPRLNGIGLAFCTVTE